MRSHDKLLPGRSMRLKLMSQSMLGMRVKLVHSNSPFCSLVVGSLLSKQASLNERLVQVQV